MDDLIDHPDAFLLLQLLERYHGKGIAFAIAPTAMSKNRNPPWDRSRIERARDILVERGYLEILSPPNARRRVAGRYRLT